MNSALIGAIAGVLVVAAISFLARGKPLRLTANGGEIGPSWIMRATALGALLMAAAATYGYLTSGQSAALILAICFGFGGIWVAYTTLPIFRLSWNDEGITGPTSSLFAPTRVTIAWSEVRSVAPTLAGSIRLEAIDGRCIYWSTAFSGHALPLQELRQRRPDLS